MASDHYAELKTSGTLSNLGQVLIKLSASNRESLLPAARRTTTHQRKAEAPTILERLGQLSPSIRNLFTPKDGIHSELGLRMICSPKPKLGIVDSFIAISYCWHYPDWKLAPAAQSINKAWEISQPMMEFVMGQEIRTGDNEGVWLDKLCINQDDEADKMAHIGVMDVVYRAARRIVILLEDVQLSSEEQEAGLAYSQFYQGMCTGVREGGLDEPAKSEFIDQYFPRKEKELEDNGQGHILGAAKPFLMKVLGARWFSRAWCVHESRVVSHGTVNNPLFLCFGHDNRVLKFEFRFVHFLTFILYRTEPPPSLSASALSDAIYDPNPTSLWQRWWRIHRCQPDDDHAAASAIQHVLSTMNLGFSVKGGLVTIALNTAAIPLVFRGHLDNMEDALWYFAAVVLAMGDLGPLLLDGQNIKFVNEKGRNATSWLSRTILTPLEEHLAIESINSITTVTKEYVELDLLVFKSLPLHPSQVSMDRASEFLARHSLTVGDIAYWHENAFARNSMKVMSTHTNSKNPSTLLDGYLQIWLALALDSGLDWIRRFPEIMRKGTEGTWFLGTLGTAMDNRLIEPAVSLLSIFGITRDNTADFEEVYLSPVVRFLTCLLDGRLKHFTLQPRRLPISTNDSAVMKTTSNRSWTAIPVAVAHLPPWHKRAWIIDPFSPAADLESISYLPNSTKEAMKVEDTFDVTISDFGDQRVQFKDVCGSWRLRRKEVVLGCRAWSSPITVDGDSVVLLRKQRVYGADDYDWAAITAARKSQIHN